jgi:lysophospholipase L1-like esterase
VLIFVVALTVVGPAQAAPPNVPATIAAIGDSISRATNACCWYGDHPSQSWSTGFNPLGPVDSHLERLMVLDPTIWGNEYNDAWAGAKMADAEHQATMAVSQQAQYVTVFLGANDVCAPSPSAMTPVKDFRRQFRAAMSVLESGLPSGAHILVASIPNVLRLYRLLKDNAIARTIWRAFDICPSALASTNVRSDRRAVRRRTIALNSVLADECASYENCRSDGLATFRYPFAASEVSRLDYFHPNLGGQSAIARVTWERSWWADASTGGGAVNAGEDMR